MKRHLIAGAVVLLATTHSIAESSDSSATSPAVPLAGSSTSNSDSTLLDNVVVGGRFGNRRRPPGIDVQKLARSVVHPSASFARNCPGRRRADDVRGGCTCPSDAPAENCFRRRDLEPRPLGYTMQDWDFHESVASIFRISVKTHWAKNCISLRFGQPDKMNSLQPAALNSINVLATDFGSPTTATAGPPR